MGGSGAFVDFEHEFAHAGSVHFDSIAAKLDALQFFALLGGELLDHVAILSEVAYLGIYFVNLTGDDNGLS